MQTLIVFRERDDCMLCGLAHLNQIKTQMSGQAQIEAETKLQRQKEMVDQMLSQRASSLQKARMVSLILNHVGCICNLKGDLILKYCF